MTSAKYPDVFTELGVKRHDLLVLPEPPSANVYWRHVGAKVLLSREAKAYRVTVEARALLAGWRVEYFGAADVAVTLDWHRSAKRGDLDNRIKIVLDALRGVAYVDDKQIVDIRARRHEDKHNPRLTVHLCHA